MPRLFRSLTAMTLHTPGKRHRANPPYRRLKPAVVSLLAASLTVAAAGAFSDDWPQWRGTARDGVWKEQGLVQKFAGPRLPATWRAPVGAGYSAPSVANGRVYVTDRVTEPAQQERIHCFDARTGKPVWTHVYDADYRSIQYQAGPRAAVTVDQNRAYTLGAVGHLHCLDAASGKVLWKHDLNAEYRLQMPIWGLAASPLIDGDLVITHIGGEDNACLVAFDKVTGRERWRALPDKPSYSAPILIQQAGKEVLVCRTGERVVGLDPQTGKLHWDHPYPPVQMVIAIATPIVEKDRLFLTSFYDGSLMLRLKQDELGVEKLWQRRGPNERSTDALHSIISTPMMVGDYLYGVDSYGELRCLDAKTGERLWESLDAVPKARWATIHFVRNGDRVWMFNERGDVIISRLTPKGYEEISRANLIQPTTPQLNQRGGVCWAHPAYANQSIYVRNDRELVCASLKAP